MDQIELGGVGPRQHPLLAVLAQVDIGVEVVGVAQMGYEAQQRIVQFSRRFSTPEEPRRRPAPPIAPIR